MYWKTTLVCTIRRSLAQFVASDAGTSYTIQCNTEMVIGWMDKNKIQAKKLKTDTMTFFLLS